MGATDEGLRRRGHRPLCPPARLPGRAHAAPALRAHLYASLPPVPGVAPDNECEKWLGQWCLKMGQLNRQVLAAAEGSCSWPVTGSLWRRLRPRVSERLPTPASDARLTSRSFRLTHGPRRPKGRSQRKATRTRSVDLRRLPEPKTMAAAIANIASHQPGSLKYQVMTAIVYYAGLGHQRSSCSGPALSTLPESGWGRLEVTEADVSFDEPGEPKTGPRSVPVPPVLVSMLRTWVDGHQLGPDDLLFRTRNGRLPTAPTGPGRGNERCERRVSRRCGFTTAATQPRRPG